jgi:tetratricopeptide (TPR) repeat protein
VAVAPSAATTDISGLAPDPDILSEETSSLQVPDARELVRRVLALAAAETEALLAGEGPRARLADLAVRCALASWDAQHPPDEALRLLELADGHPLAPRLRLAAALAAGDEASLTAVEPALGEAPALQLELAEAWLWRHGRVDRAGAVLERLLDGAPLPPAPVLATARELAALVHTGGAWQRALELRRSALREDADPEEVAALAALALDRGGDAADALALCWSKLERYPGPDAPAPAPAPASALGWLRTIDVAIDAAGRLGDPRWLELLERRAALVAALPDGAAAAAATRHALASELERAGRAADAARLWLQLADDAAAQAPAVGRQIALVRAAWSAAARGGEPEARAIALAAHRRLAVGECAEVSASHAWRALELAAVTGDTSVGDLARAVVEAAGSPAAERWLDELELAAPGAAAIARYEGRGGAAVRWAAAIAERRGEPRKALELWARAAAEPGASPAARDHLLRLHRGEVDTEALAAAYAAWAEAEPDGRSAAALWCARGVVDLFRGDFGEAEESLLRAAKRAPGDPFCRAMLAELYRFGHRFENLATVLAELSGSLASRAARGAATREYAELLDEHLGDPDTARLAIERMLADRPDDVEAMLVLARLYERDGAITEELPSGEQGPTGEARALELRRRAVELAPARAGEIWIEIARGEERRGDLVAALAALDRAAEDRHPDAPREQARLHRAAGNLERALAIARAELATDPPLGQRMQLQTQIGGLLTELGREPEAAVAAYLDVLSLEPDQTEALAGIEAPARALGLWDELARAFRGAPQTPRNLEVLAEALEHIAEWSELAEVRRRQLEAAATPADKARRAAELAALHERELGDVEGAIRMLLIAQAAHHDDARQHDLLRLLRAAERWAEVAAVLERALPLVPADDVARQVELLLELAELRAHRLGRQAEALAAYEAVLERRPLEPTAAAALEVLYEQLGRDRDLARLLEARAEAEPEPGARAQLFARVAALRHGRGDVEGALAAYTAAFSAEPASREVFTAMERVCYKAERWAAAMQLYATAIAYVEAGHARAYRLGDLYARRANVQLNFLGQTDAALESYQKVIEVDSQPQAAATTLENICKRRGDYAPLIEAWERRAETQRDPQRKADAIRMAAKLSAEHVGNTRQAMQLHHKLLQIDPSDLGAASALERYYEEAEDRSGLVNLLKLRLRSARNSSESIELLKRIARASEENARDVVGATEHYQKILELQPENREALDALGRIYESTEQWAELIDVTRKQIKVTSDRNTKALLYFRCGSVMEAKFGREADAIRYYDAAIKTSSACLPAVHGLRDLYRRREDWPRVIETLEIEVRLWEDDKERAGVFAQIGRIYEVQLADLERAMHFYESALTVDPECLPANQALFEHFFALRAWDKALPISNLLVQRASRDGDPTSRSEFYRKRGVVARMAGDARGAAESVIVALEIKPMNVVALDELGSLAREEPDADDFEGTYRELEKVYKKRDDAGPLLARVLVGRAAILAREGDLDEATALYRQALEIAPADLTVVCALVDFHADMRRWSDAIAAIERFVRAEASAPADRIEALMRKAALHADGELDSPRALAVLEEVLELAPTHQDAYYLLAQQHFLLGQYAAARAAMDRVIELATSPGQPLSAEALARYYYYQGRILDAAGETRAAAPQYRRAIDYDPGYAPPALVLARRAADGGDQRQAEGLLIEAAHAAMAQGGPRAAVPLQRGLARILLASGDRAAAIEAYRGILNVDPDGASDRVALAEIYAVDDPARAIGELRKVLDRDIHHAPAYRLLASFYSRTGDTERASRVLTVLDLLGFAEETDRTALQRLRAARDPAPLRQLLDDAHRERFLLTPAARDPLGEVFGALAEEISGMVGPPSFGANVEPAHPGSEPSLVQLASELAALYGVEPELYVADKVPGLAAAAAFPRRMIVLDRSLLADPEPALRFLLGYAFEAIRGGYATLLQVGARWRRELAQLLRSLLGPESERSGRAADLVEGATDEVQELLARHAGQLHVDPGVWIDGMLALAKRAGLLACDDFPAAIWMVARLSGERLASHDETVALGSVLGGPDLVRFYLSDDYQHLRDVLSG